MSTCRNWRQHLKKGDIVMVNMQCVAHRNKMNEATRLRNVIAGDESRVTWLTERLIRLLKEFPDRLISMNVRDAFVSFSKGYERDGLDGALVHVKWMINSLHELPNNPDNRAVLQTAEDLAGALQYEW